MTNVEFDIQKFLSDMESRQTAVMVEGFKNLDGRLTSLDERVRKLETWRSYLIGAWAVATAAVGYAFKAVWAKP